MLDIEKQVISLDNAIQLKNLDVPQDSYFHWHPNSYDQMVIGHFARAWENFYSAFTVAELGEMLFKNGVFKTQHISRIWYLDKPGFPIPFEAETEADVRAKCLIYLMQKKMGT